MKIKFTILGCGSSLGIPRIDGYFGKCNPREPKNFRTRCCALVTSGKKNILIDTSPDIKNQLIKAKVKNIDKVFYTHPHADQTHGINELRVFYLKNKRKLPVYADKFTAKYLLQSFGYCFKGNKDYPATLSLNSLRNIHSINEQKNISLRSIQVQHGLIKSICYIINKKCAYASDVSKIFNKDLKHFMNLRFLIIDCLRYQKHPSHFNLSEALDFINLVKPKKAILTNLNNEIDYRTLKKELPRNVIPAYDGLSFTI